MRIEVRRMINQDAYRITNGKKYVVVDDRLLNNIGYTEYDNGEFSFPLVDSIETVEAGEKFDSLGDIPYLPEGSLLTHDDRVLIREEFCYLDLETRKPISHAYDVTVHRVGY